MPRKKKSKFPLAKLPKILILGIVVLLGFSAWGIYISLIKPLSVNEIGSYYNPFQYALQLQKGYVAVNDSGALNPDLTKGFVAEAWVRPYDATFSAMRVIDKTNGSNKSFSLWIEGGFNSGEATYRVNYNFDVATSNCYSPYTIFNQQVYTNPSDVTTWHHVAGVINPDGKMDIFVDGKKSVTNTNSVASTCAQTGFPVNVGARVQTSSAVDSSFVGELDEVHVANYAKYTDNFTPVRAPLSYTPATAFLYHLDFDTADANQNEHYGSAFGNYSYVSSTIYTPPSPAPSPSPVKSSPYPSAPPGCTYQQVQCIQAPCDPVLYCSSPSPYVSPQPSPTPMVTSIPRLSPSPYSSPKPSPTPVVTSVPTPTPTPPPGCYWQEPNFCIQLFGYTCPSQLVCPTPTPTPPVPIPSTLPSPIAIGSPIPVWPPTPPPTSDPSPLVSCVIDTYKLSGRNTVSYNESNKVNPNNIVAKSGDRYAFNMRLTNLKPYPLTGGLLKLTAWTENAQGANAPYTVYSADPNNCQTGFSDKSIRCVLPELKLKIGETVRPPTAMIVDINSFAKIQSTSLTYKGIYSASTISCPTVTLKIAPNTVRKCYGRWPLRICRTIIVK